MTHLKTHKSREYWLISTKSGHMDSCLMDAASLLNLCQTKSHISHNTELDMLHQGMALMVMKIKQLVLLNIFISKLCIYMFQNMPVITCPFSQISSIHSCFYAFFSFANITWNLFFIKTEVQKHCLVLRQPSFSISTFCQKLTYILVGMPAEMLLVVVLQEDVSIIFLMAAPVIDIKWVMLHLC